MLFSVICKTGFFINLKMAPLHQKQPVPKVAVSYLRLVPEFQLEKAV